MMLPARCSRAVRTTLTLVLAGSAFAGAHAHEKFTFLSSWYAQAEHGGYYQAIAEDMYKQAGLDVTVRMGGPQVNGVQLLAAGQADCVMGSTDLQMVQAREGGVPLVTVAAVFQKDPQVLIAHDDVKRFEDLKGKTILIASTAQRGFWPWLKARFGFTDAQVRPYTFNIQPFVADKNAAQQGYLTSETFAIEKAGVKHTILSFSDYGYPAYAATITCMEKTLKERGEVVRAFIKASMEGYKRYLANPAPGNALIRKANPNMSEEQLAYGVARIKEMQLITGGAAEQAGIGTISPERVKASYDFMVEAGLINPAKVKVDDAYDFDFVRNAKVLP